MIPNSDLYIRPMKIRFHPSGDFGHPKASKKFIIQTSRTMSGEWAGAETIK